MLLYCSFRKRIKKPLSRPSDIYTPFGRNLYEPKYNSSEFFDFVKNRLADYSSFLTEELNKDLEVHSVALVHPNFAYGKTSLNPELSEICLRFLKTKE